MNITILHLIHSINNKKVNSITMLYLIHSINNKKVNSIRTLYLMHSINIGKTLIKKILLIINHNELFICMCRYHCKK